MLNMCIYSTYLVIQEARLLEMQWSGELCSWPLIRNETDETDDTAYGKHHTLYILKKKR